MKNIISGTAKIAGVMGFPVSASLSPRLHNYWLEKYEIDGAYIPLAVTPQNLEQAIRALPKLGFRGCNLTIPHKEAAVYYVDEIDKIAHEIGAINTIVIDETGKIIGKNTDAFGFISNIKNTQENLGKYLEHCVILGAGGASKAIVKALIDEGAEQITIVNRTLDKAEELAQRFGSNIFVATYGKLPELLKTASMLVNTTSLGMKNQPPLEIDISTLPETTLVSDIVYNPLETELIKSARARGNVVVDGLGMLIYQAIPGFELWFGRSPEIDSQTREHLLLP